MNNILPKLRTAKGNIRTLLGVTEYKSIKGFMTDNPTLNKEESIKFLLDNYNSIIDEINFKPVISKITQKYTKFKNLNIEFNNAVANTPFVNTTMSNQISVKFSLGEYSIKTMYKDFIDVEINNIKKKISSKIFKEYERIITSIDFVNTSEKLIRNIYYKLMVHKGQLNRIYITNTETGNVVSSRLQDNFTYENFSEVIIQIIQSAGLAVLGTLTFTIQYRNLPTGGSCVDVPQFLKNKTGISLIINDDDLCGQRCLALADCKNTKMLSEMRNSKFKSRFDKATNLICKEFNLNGRMSFIDFDKYANARQKQVIILSGLFVEMYSTPTEYEEQIYIYYDTSIKHYHYINDINSASNDSKRNNKWCKYCLKSIRRELFNGHKCKELKCGCCYTHFCSVVEKDNHFNNAKINKSWTMCDTCNLWCVDAECLLKHQEKCNGKSKRCIDCKKWCDIEHFEEHTCGEKFCRNCDNYYIGDNHRCFITPIDPAKGDYDLNQDGERVLVKWAETIYVYDFESMFDEKYNHIVNLCIVKQLFNNSVEYVFYNIEDFVKFAVSCKSTTFIAHNGKAYDNWLVHKYIIKHTAQRPNKLILAGNKIMYMKIKSVRFIDSLNHIAQGLATFPETFGFNELKKGFFPYMFNTIENQNYVGSIPDKKYFNYNSMTSNKYKEFNEWYELQKDIVYDFKKELYEYCLSDVDILKRSLEIYVNDALQTTGINPLRCSTIASYAMRVYRTNFLKDNKIAVLTKEEYDFCKRGFFGGRTEVFKLFQSWTEDQIKEGIFGKYVDIQSLYPAVQFYDELPCGVPKWDNEPIYNNIIDYLDTHYGYIECDIECPQDLHIPLLAEKKNNKLMFDLVDKNQKVYSSIELLRAVEIGYKITKIYKSLTFEKSNNMFKEYMKTFLKIKTQCAGYKKDDIDDYIKRYYDSCGVLLEKEKIIANSGMKLLAKILLNSLWGKFGQNDELPTTMYIKNDAWFKLLNRHIKNEVELKNEILIDDDTLYVSYIEKVENKTCLVSTNLALAGMTTANARLRLYKELYKLSDRVIYCDTDSIIYEYRKNEYNVTESDCLGEFELEKDGNIKEIYALAPKTYGYKTLTGEQHYKCKGITLNYGNQQIFTYDKLKELIIGDTDGIHKKIVTKSNDFIKDNKTGNIYTKMDVDKDTNYNKKAFKRNFNDDDGTSSPFKNFE